jgi:hypothetical protein
MGVVAPMRAGRRFSRAAIGESGLPAFATRMFASVEQTLTIRRNEVALSPNQLHIKAAAADGDTPATA